MLSIYTNTADIDTLTRNTQLITIQNNNNKIIIKNKIYYSQRLCEHTLQNRPSKSQLFKKKKNQKKKSQDKNRTKKQTTKNKTKQRKNK